MSATAWADVINLDLTKSLNPATIEYNENGIWTGTYNDVDYTWLEFGDENGEFMLSHLIDGEGASWGGYYWDGFTLAIGGDQTDYGQPGSSGTWTTKFGGCMAGGGCVINEDGTVTADPSEPYLVAFYSWFYPDPSNQVMFMDKDGNMEFEPVGVYVCNHPWPYYGCEHGDGFGRAFGEGDYFELTAHGVAADGSETTVSINLVEFVDGELHALNDWTFFDLSGLGEVTSVYFTLNSTDTGDWGMNTAAYFCMDKFQVKGEEDEPVIPELTHPGYWLVMIDEFGVEHYYSLKEGVDGSYTSTITLDYYPWGEFYWDPELSDAENEANRPQVPFYFIIDDVVYGAENELQPTAMGEAANTESNPLNGGATEMYTVPVGYSYTLGVYVNPTNDDKFVYCAQGFATGIDEMNASKTVASVRYFNMAGQEVQQPSGLAIKVTTYTDGTTSAAKVIK